MDQGKLGANGPVDDLSLKAIHLYRSHLAVLQAQQAADSISEKEDEDEDSVTVVEIDASERPHRWIQVDAEDDQRTYVSCSYTFADVTSPVHSGDSKGKGPRLSLSRGPMPVAIEDEVDEADMRRPLPLTDSDSNFKVMEEILIPEIDNHDEGTARANTERAKNLEEDLNRFDAVSNSRLSNKFGAVMSNTPHH